MKAHLLIALATLLLATGLAACGQAHTEQTTRPDTVDDSLSDEAYEGSGRDDSCGGDYDCKRGSICAGDHCEAVCPKPEPVSIAFPTSEARVPDKDMPALETISLCMRAWPDSKIRLDGHTGTHVTVDGASKKLTKEEMESSADRFARSVSHQLTNQFLVVQRRIVVASKGATEAVCTDPDEACQSRNRRVDVVWERLERQQAGDEDFEVQ